MQKCVCRIFHGRWFPRKVTPELGLKGLWEAGGWLKGAGGKFGWRTGVNRDTEEGNIGEGHAEKTPTWSLLFLLLKPGEVGER